LAESNRSIVLPLIRTYYKSDADNSVDQLRITILTGFAAAISIDSRSGLILITGKKKISTSSADVLTSIDLPILEYRDDYRALPCRLNLPVNTTIPVIRDVKNWRGVQMHRVFEVRKPEVEVIKVVQDICVGDSNAFRSAGRAARINERPGPLPDRR